MSQSKVKLKANRERHFKRWWKKNHHRTEAQAWLCRNSKRIAYAYNIGPAAFEDIQFITKRFFSSEWPRLKQEEAWKLWKHCHPLVDERHQRLIDTAVRLDEKSQEINALKAERDGKPEYKRVPLVFVKKSRSVNRVSR